MQRGMISLLHIRRFLVIDVARALGTCVVVFHFAFSIFIPFSLFSFAFHFPFSNVQATQKVDKQ